MADDDEKETTRRVLFQSLVTLHASVLRERDELARLSDGTGALGVILDRLNAQLREVKTQIANLGDE